MSSEIYNGIKFTVEFLSHEAPNDSRLETLKHWCRIFHEYHLAPPYPGGSAGNLSFRLNAGQLPFIITGTAVGLKDQLGNDKFVRVEACDLEKKQVQVKGLIEPSSETILHYAIYKQRPDVQVIFHGHSDEILAATEALKIPETHTEAPYGSIELIQRVLEILEQHAFIILRSHGFVAMGSDLNETGDLAMEILNKTKGVNL